jgi:hypothetical protein
MVRFSAAESEIVALIRRMTSSRKRRIDAAANPGRGCIHLLVPLEATSRDDLRFRHTAAPLARRLALTDSPVVWGLYAGGSDKKRDARSVPAAVRAAKDPKSGLFLVDAEAIGLIVLQLGPPTGPERRREGLLLAADHAFHISDKVPHEGELSGQDSARFSRDVVERSARRLRRRGEWRDGRWFVAASV